MSLAQSRWTTGYDSYAHLLELFAGEALYIMEMLANGVRWGVSQMFEQYSDWCTVKYLQ